MTEKISNFEILECIQIGKHCVAKLKYPEVNNFSGVKICLFINCESKYLYERKTLNPHFCNICFCPFARFIPTTQGMAEACRLAKLMIVKRRAGCADISIA